MWRSYSKFNGLLLYSVLCIWLNTERVHRELPSGGVSRYTPFIFSLSSKDLEAYLLL